MMTLLIVLGLIGLVIVFLKLEHHSRRVMIISFIILVAVLYLSFVSFFNSGNIDLRSPKGVVNAIYVYVGWFGDAAVKVFDVGKSTVTGIGNVIKMNNTQEVNDGRR